MCTRIIYLVILFFINTDVKAQFGFENYKENPLGLFYWGPYGTMSDVWKEIKTEDSTLFLWSEIAYKNKETQSFWICNSDSSRIIKTSFFNNDSVVQFIYNTRNDNSRINIVYLKSQGYLLSHCIADTCIYQDLNLDFSLKNYYIEVNKKLIYVELYNEKEELERKIWLYQMTESSKEASNVYINLKEMIWYVDFRSVYFKLKEEKHFGPFRKTIEYLTLEEIEQAKLPPIEFNKQKR